MIKDILLYQTVDNGDLIVDFADLRTTKNIESAIYLSLFGGNEEDDGRGDNTELTWWGNLIESDPAKRYVSKFQALGAIPITSANLRRREEAAKEDLAWLVQSTEDFEVNAIISGLNKIKVNVSGNINGEAFNITAEDVWQ